MMKILHDLILRISGTPFNNKKKKKKERRRKEKKFNIPCHLPSPTLTPPLKIFKKSFIRSTTWYKFLTSSKSLILFFFFFEDDKIYNYSIKEDRVPKTYSNHFNSYYPWITCDIFFWIFII